MIDEKTMRVQQMWNEQGMTYTDIANKLGCTRNAVAGLVARAKAKGVYFVVRGSPIKPQVVALPPKPRVVKLKLKPRPPPLVHPVLDGPVTLMEHEGWQCREVVGQRAHDKVWLYCEKPRLQNYSYCKEHNVGRSMKARTGR